MVWNLLQENSFYNASARERALGLVDEGTFYEFLGPADKFPSPHLPILGEAYQFDDGIVVGVGKIQKRPIFVISNEGKFIGGAIGEVSGTKMVTTLYLALETYNILLKEKPNEMEEKRPVVLISFETGGVRLHEANAGLLAHSEVMEALQNLRGKVPVFSLIGSKVGCFGGMGFVAASTDVIIMSEKGRLGLTGPEVIEQEMGRKEFDSTDKGLVWRCTGGKHKYIMKDCNFLVDDSIGAFRNQIKNLISLTYTEVEKFRRIGSLKLVEEQMELVEMCIDNNIKDSVDLWGLFGNENSDIIPEMQLQDFLHNVKRRP